MRLKKTEGVRRMQMKEREQEKGGENAGNKNEREGEKHRSILRGSGEYEKSGVGKQRKNVRERKPEDVTREGRKDI